MEKFQNGRGEGTTADDPKRLIWYAIDCGYWTDEWDTLALAKMAADPSRAGIPICPKCGCPGCMVDAESWDRGADVFDERWPGYKKFIAEAKGTCFGRGGIRAELKKRGFSDEPIKQPEPTKE
jgi:hypothetical protein